MALLRKGNAFAYGLQYGPSCFLGKAPDMKQCVAGKPHLCVFLGMTKILLGLFRQDKSI